VDTYQRSTYGRIEENKGVFYHQMIHTSGNMKGIFMAVVRIKARALVH
jgi:hypothetical protein